MALTPAINQNAANITFPSIVYGAEPAVIPQVTLASGFTYRAMGSLIGTPISTPGSSYFLYDSTDNTQELWGITYDTWLNANNLAAALAPFTMTGNISTAAGSISTPTVGNIAGNNGLNPSLARSVVTNISINTSLLTLGARITGTGIPANSTILQILSSSAIVISGNVTATTTGVTLTSYSVQSADALVSVATVQSNTTQWIESALVGVNGATDITSFITANPTLARSFIRYNGATAIPVVTFTFIGG